MNRYRSTQWGVEPCAVQRVGVALLIVLAGVVGCSLYDRSADEVAQAVEKWQRQPHHMFPASQPAPASRAGPESMAETASETPAPEASLPTAGPESLDAYVREALERNPAIQAAIANVEATLEKIPQVTSLPDPVLRAIVRPEPIQTAAGDVVFTLAVGQKIPLPAKLDRAGRIAAAEVRMAIERLNATRLRVIADVERAFFRLYLAERSLELTQENLELLQTLERVVESQYRVGRVGQPDVLRVQTEVSNLLNDEDVFRRQRSAAAAALNQLLDRPITNKMPATKTTELRTVDDRIEALLALAREHNPELAALAHQTQRDRQGVKLADLGYWPDLTVGLEWSRLDGRAAFEAPSANSQAINRASEAGDDNWALTFQLDLPIWAQRIESAKREARQKLERTLRTRRDRENLVAFRVYDAWIRTQTKQDTVRLLESTIIPQATQTYDVSLTAYEVGEADFLTVIDNWRILLKFELMLHRELAGLEMAFAELQREVGLELARERTEGEEQSERTES